MWSLWPLMMEALADWAIDFFPSMGNCSFPYLQRARLSTEFMEHDFIRELCRDKNMEDNDIVPAPKLIEVVFQNCRGQVDHWLELYLRITVERLRHTEKSYLKCLFMQVIADALYYNAALTLSILQKLGVASEIFHLWFHLLQQVKKSGMRADFKREHEKKVCCLGLTSLLALPADQLPAEALGRVFRANLDLLVAYKEQVAVHCVLTAEAAKEEEAEDDDDMDGFQTDDEDEDGSGFDKEMGVDADDGEDTSHLESWPNRHISLLVQLLPTLSGSIALAKSFWPHDDDYDDSDDDFSDDEELQSPIDEVDPFVFFVDTIKVIQSSDPSRFVNLTQTLEFNYQALANGVAQHAEQRRAEIEKEKIEKSTAATAS
ncbi:Importin beta-like SAD2 [Glycine max]|nr:Importin beta-like SAD2 [Glycine max]